METICKMLGHKDVENGGWGADYGVIGQYRLTKRLAVNMELGGATTFRDFDGAGYVLLECALMGAALRGVLSVDEGNCQGR